MGNIANAAAASSGGSSTFIIFIIIIIGAMYFLVMRPGRRRQQKTQQQQNAVQPGARVRTTAGMYATVVAVDGDDVVLEVAPDIEVRYMKRAIMEVLGDTGTAEEETAEDDEPAEDETAEYDEHDEPAEDDETAEHDEPAAPAASYGEDLTINGKPDRSKANGDHSETATPESTASKE
jgi:preprotein translocase subunit YajC